MPTENKVNVSAEEHLSIQQYTDEKMMCDFGHTFFSNSVKLIAFRNSLGSSLGETMYLDEEQKARSSMNSAPPSGFLVACPVCGVVHIEGFTPLEKGEALQDDKNVAPDRKIEMGL